MCKFCYLCGVGPTVAGVMQCPGSFQDVVVLPVRTVGGEAKIIHTASLNYWLSIGL